MPQRWPAGAMQRAMRRRQSGRVNAEAIRGITVRPLRAGDTSVVQAVFDRLEARSRLLRYGGAKNVLLPADLAALARVDANHHVLVAYAADGPIGIARLVRSGKAAEVAVEIVDAWQARGVGKLLMERLAADARAAGIERLEATVQLHNTASRALMRRFAAVTA
jgi:N-acetylglutamate synthase-like GNAT family acetyltransferase